MRRSIAVAALLLAGPTMAVARPIDRELVVPADKGWQHAASGVVLPSPLAELARTRLFDNGTDENDIVAEFRDADGATTATVYIFHPGLMSVPVWFDRTRTVMELRDIYGGLAPATADPVAFAPPGSTIPSGLRLMFAPKSGDYRATGVALAPVGEWLVAVRLSAKTLDLAAADAKLSEVIAAIRWPSATTPPAAAATPVRACASTLNFKKAKIVKPTMDQIVMGAMLGSVIANGKAEGAPPVFCREAIKPTIVFGVYRPDGATDAYTLAIADSGRAASVAKMSISLPGMNSPEGYSVTYRDLGTGIATYPSFDRLPQPEQVAALVLKGQPLSVSDAKAKNVTIHMPPSR